MRLPAITTTLLIAISPAFADTVELSGGGHLDGTVEQKAEVVIVALDDEIQVAIPASRVRRVITGDQLAAYRQRVVAAQWLRRETGYPVEATPHSHAPDEPEGDRP